ncbi:hypothetical protein [Ectobacillus ponti]|uniref:Uncharacterized protein n=1 Tax=Ectobacillus ponti TaxID=2961894 RepID=A0AA41X5B9_9BACI|nr:hypothetical protein [Ectobacillus ponti]MCP8969201.1 hypothetical protein [Ectobacillus ponti]
MSMYLQQQIGGWQFVEAYQVELDGQTVITDSYEEAMQLYGPVHPPNPRTYFIKGYGFKNVHVDMSLETTPIRFFLTKEAAEAQWRALQQSQEHVWEQNDQPEQPFL